MLSRLLILFLVVSCASRKGDPLKNTKKLMKEGHTTLYQNGAFQVPATKIKLIPPGPDAIDLAKELSGLRAKESFLKYINEVKASSVVIYDGAKKSYKLAGEVDKGIYQSLSELAPKLRKDSIVILNAGFATSKKIIGGSWEAGSHFQKTARIDMPKLDLKQSSFTGGKDFVRGYVELPSKLTRRKDNISEVASVKKFVENFKESNEFRRKTSAGTTYLITDSFANYEKDISSSFNNAEEEIQNTGEFGPSLALFKALGWMVHGIVWQGIVKPIGKLSAGAVGYTMVNGVAYPVVLISKNGYTTTKIAVEVVKESAMGVAEITAPSLELALSSVLYSGEFIAKQSTEKVANTTGFIVENGVEYIAAPIGNALIKTGGAISGVAVGVGSGVLSGAVRGTGEVLGLSSHVVSKTAATGVLAGGVTAYTIKGTAEMAYEVTKATVVPPALVLGSGLTLSYGTLTQLSGQAVLAASDAAYLVLSLEGPNWVVYSVKGLVSQNDLPANTVVDLQKLRESGEEIRKVPATQEEIKKMIEHLE